MPYQRALFIGVLTALIGSVDFLEEPLTLEELGRQLLGSNLGQRDKPSDPVPEVLLVYVESPESQVLVSKHR